VQEIFPSLVEGEKDGEKMQSLNYTGLIAVLVKEVQLLKKTVEVLKEENKTMRLDIDKMLQNK
jgi:regulator of replication initiation timing